MSRRRTTTTGDPYRRIEGAHFARVTVVECGRIAGEVVLTERLFPRAERDREPWRAGHQRAVAGGGERADSRGHAQPDTSNQHRTPKSGRREPTNPSLTLPNRDEL
jgi:hypothetical protein